MVITTIVAYQWRQSNYRCFRAALFSSRNGMKSNASRRSAVCYVISDPRLSQNIEIIITECAKECVIDQVNLERLRSAFLLIAVDLGRIDNFAFSLRADFCSRTSSSRDFRPKLLNICIFWRISVHIIHMETKVLLNASKWGAKRRKFHSRVPKRTSLGKVSKLVN